MIFLNKESLKLISSSSRLKPYTSTVVFLKFFLVKYKTEIKGVKVFAMAASILTRKSYLHKIIWLRSSGSAFSI